MRTTRADLFHHAEKRNFDREAPEDRVFSVVVPADATLADIVGRRLRGRVPKGSARAGCYEVRTDAGMWSSPTRSRLNPKTAVFKTRDELEAEEASPNDGCE